MTDLSRRVLLKQVALAGAGLQAGALSTGLANASTAKKMSIAKYRTSPAESEGVAEEATRLTRRAIQDLGGMSRFVSKGDAVWIKPNIAWDRTPGAPRDLWGIVKDRREVRMTRVGPVEVKP